MIWKQPKCPNIHEWYKELWIPLCGMLLNARKGKKSHVICSEMDGTRG